MCLCRGPSDYSSLSGMTITFIPYRGLPEPAEVIGHAVYLLRRRRPTPDDEWLMDKVFVHIPTSGAPSTSTAMGLTSYRSALAAPKRRHGSSAGCCLVCTGCPA